jgi:hypothetical protein
VTAEAGPDNVSGGQRRSAHSSAVNLTNRLEQLLRQEFAHEEKLARVAGSDTAPVPGAWRATDHLAHFSLWRRLFLDHTRAVLAGKNPSAPPEDLDAVNESQLVLDRQLPAGELITRWRHGCQGMLDFLQACRGADWTVRRSGTERRRSAPRLSATATTDPKH